MQEKKYNFLQDDNGNLSSMRLYSLISLIVSIVLTIIGFLKGNLNSQMVSVIGMYLAAAFAPKTIQKFVETKDITKNE